jgi:hypothetical protein
MTQTTRVVKKITGDLFTGAYRMTGRIDVGAAGVIGLLNDTTRSGAMVEDVYISYVHTPGSILDHFQQVRFAKRGMEAILLPKRDDIGPAGVARGGFAKVAQYNVLITTDVFEIRGVLELPGKFEPETVLFEGTGRFFPLYNATVNAYIRPDAKYSGEAVLINREKVSTVCGGE